MVTRAKTGGRKAGTPNKLSSGAKEHVHAVFVRLGGVTAMVKWAKDNQTDFYRLYAKLLPIEATVSGPDGGPIIVQASNLDEKL